MEGDMGVFTVGEENGAFHATTFVILDKAECDGEARGSFEIFGGDVDQNVLAVGHDGQFVAI